jgi:hypothetical protein
VKSGYDADRTKVIYSGMSFLLAVIDLMDLARSSNHLHLYRKDPAG